MSIIKGRNASCFSSKNDTLSASSQCYKSEAVFVGAFSVYM